MISYLKQKNKMNEQKFNKDRIVMQDSSLVIEITPFIIIQDDFFDRFRCI